MIKKIKRAKNAVVTKVVGHSVGSLTNETDKILDVFTSTVTKLNANIEKLRTLARASEAKADEVMENARAEAKKHQDTANNAWNKACDNGKIARKLQQFLTD